MLTLPFGLFDKCHTNGHGRRDSYWISCVILFTSSRARPDSFHLADEVSRIGAGAKSERFRYADLAWHGGSPCPFVPVMRLRFNRCTVFVNRALYTEDSKTGNPSEQRAEQWISSDAKNPDAERRDKPDEIKDDIDHSPENKFHLPFFQALQSSRYHE